MTQTRSDFLQTLAFGIATATVGTAVLPLLPLLPAPIGYYPIITRVIEETHGGLTLFVDMGPAPFAGATLERCMDRCVPQVFHGDITINIEEPSP